MSLDGIIAASSAAVAPDATLRLALNHQTAKLQARSTARAVMAAGLHPSLGLMHSNRGNAMVLVDDLMEPFRPTVDREVHRLRGEGFDAVTSETKAALARVMVVDLPTDEGISPLMTCLERLASSLAKIFAAKRSGCICPSRACRWDSDNGEPTR